MKDVPVIDKMDNLEIEASTKIYDWLPLLSNPSKKRSDVQGDCSTYWHFWLCSCASSVVFICTFHPWMTSTDRKKYPSFFQWMTL